MIGIAVEYRLSNRADITPLEAMEDTRDFMLWLRANAESLNVDPQRVVLKGISAGGHLVNAISVLQEGHDSNTVPNALILVSPAIDTEEPYFRSLLSDSEKSADLSPLLNLKSGLNLPKTLIQQVQARLQIE